MTARYDSRRYALVNRWNPRNLELIRDWVAPAPGDRILDVGCGKGHLVKALRDLGVDAAGIDLNPNASDVAVVAGVQTMSATNLDFDDAAFDAVVSFHAIEHIPHIDEALREMSRVVKPTGKVLLVYPAEPVRGLYAIPTSVILHRTPFKARQVHVHKLNPARVAELARTAGLRQVRKGLRMWPSPEYASLFEPV
ncbi:MAG TPA: methyltransferase domain-containing protein [Acidimicrobiia bacterium]|nr:methyltransferase domain-containing protein [Acidimicrobiia bacterium]